jgi:cytochrome c oxidase subunit IV
MSDSHDVAKHVRIYIGVFIALLCGTLLTVGMYYIHFESIALGIAIALFIASVKAFLVAGFFMHLISEKTAIYAVMATTVFFFIALMSLTVFSIHDIPHLK